MGIDIYARWKGQTKRECEAQVTGWSIVHGYVGYLREAYHGGPYATRFLVREAFEAKDAVAHIPAATLRQRLPQTVLLALFRHHLLYDNDNEPEALPDSVDAIAAKVAEVYAPGGAIEQARTGEEGDKLARLVPPDVIKRCMEAIAKRDLPDFAQTFADFVDLCERKERETGEACRIVASY